jgi:hypothetical protein
MNRAEPSRVCGGNLTWHEDLRWHSRSTVPNSLTWDRVNQLRVGKRKSRLAILVTSVFQPFYRDEYAVINRVDGFPAYLWSDHWLALRSLTLQDNRLSVLCFGIARATRSCPLVSTFETSARFVLPVVHLIHCNLAEHFRWVHSRGLGVSPIYMGRRSPWERLFHVW